MDRSWGTLGVGVRWNEQGQWVLREWISQGRRHSRAPVELQGVGSPLFGSSWAHQPIPGLAEALELLEPDNLGVGACTCHKACICWGGLCNQRH